MHITEWISPELVFLKARELIGIPAEHPFTIHSENGLGWDNGVWIRSHPDGFCSALDVSHADGTLLVRHCDEWCEKPCDYHDKPEYPPPYVDVRLDTTYGYLGEDGERCGDVHRRVTAGLGAWLDEQGIDWWCDNEYTGEWAQRTPGPFERSPA
jgi:hypothetical protein